MVDIYWYLPQYYSNVETGKLFLPACTSLLGDALTWLGLALLAFELTGNTSAIVLSSALTLRVTAFVLLSPLAGAIVDRFDRKQISDTNIQIGIARFRINSN